MVVGQNEAESSQENSTFTSRSGSSNGIFAEYHHKDHLGNVRVAFTDRNDDQFVTLLGTANDIEATQQLDYYPFGLQQQGDGLFHTQQEPGNRYRYNGKEYIEEIGLLDYGARWYDPAIGRWNAVDPLAETYPTVNPYAYVANNPLIFIDPDGMRLEVTFSGDGAREVYEYLVNNAFQGQFEVSLTEVEDKAGTFQVDVVATEGGGDYSKMTENGQRFHDEFTLVTENQTYTASQEIVIDDGNTDIGNYDFNRMDVGDIMALPEMDHCQYGQCGPTRDGKLIHETKEQFMKAVKGYKKGERRGYSKAHENAQAAEDDVNGNTRGIDGWGGSAGAVQNYSSTVHGKTKWTLRYGRKPGARTTIKRNN